MKYPSETTWESKIASAKVVRFHLVGIVKALYEILCDTSDASDCADIEGLLHNLTSFESLVSCAIWYNVLSKVNLVSKSLQAIDMQVDKAIILISSVCSWIQEFRQNGFSQVLHEAREIADLINSQCEFITVATEFEQHRVRLRRRLEGENATHFVIADPEQQYKVEVFLTMVDKFALSLSSRFEQLKKYSNDFDLLLNLTTLNQCEVNEDSGRKKKEKCSHLATCLGDVVDANDLYAEIMCFINLPNKSDLNSAISILRYFIKYQLLDTFPNLFTCTKILTTIPVSVAASERSFSKLKLIKNYLRSKMSQHHLNALAMMSIESEVSNQIDFNDVINTFAVRRARRQKFI